MAANYGNLGTIAQTRNDLEQAEELYRKSLQIADQLGYREGMATAYWSLGVISQTRDDLEQAEQLYRRARALYFDIGITGEVDALDRDSFRAGKQRINKVDLAHSGLRIDELQERSPSLERFLILTEETEQRRKITSDKSLYYVNLPA